MRTFALLMLAVAVSTVVMVPKAHAGQTVQLDYSLSNCTNIGAPLWFDLQGVWYSNNTGEMYSGKVGDPSHAASWACYPTGGNGIFQVATTYIPGGCTCKAWWAAADVASVHYDSYIRKWLFDTPTFFLSSQPVGCLK